MACPIMTHSLSLLSSCMSAYSCCTLWYVLARNPNNASYPEGTIAVELRSTAGAFLPLRVRGFESPYQYNQKPKGILLECPLVFGANGEIRTRRVSPADFKSAVYAVPPHSQSFLQQEYYMLCAIVSQEFPAYKNFLCEYLGKESQTRRV